MLLASTEGVSLLLRTRERGSAIHRCALAMTVLLAACAFVLAFDALRDLAIRSGIRAHLAWLWPIAVDVTIAHATVALLSLSRTPTADSAKDVDDITQLLETPSTPAATEYGHTGAAVAPIAETIALIRELVLPAQI